MLNSLRPILAILLAGLALPAGACAPASPAVPADFPGRNWKMSIVTNDESSWAKGARLFSDLVEQRTDGKVQITVYPNGQLAGGNQVKELSMLRDGSINLTYHSNLLYTNLDQAFAVISLPWLLSDYAQVDAALSGDAGSQLLKKAEAQGIIGLAFGENGFRQVTNSKRAIRTPDDLRGLKIRIPGVKLYNSIYEALGAEPVTMDFGLVPEALRQGKVDGQENPIDIITSSRLDEVQRHITLWNYSYDALILGINKKDWDGLPGSVQSIVRQAAAEGSKEQIRLSRSSARTQVDLLWSQGMAVTELTPTEIEAFRAKMAPVYAEWSPKIGEPLIRQFQGRQAGLAKPALASLRTFDVFSPAAMSHRHEASR